jgi:hypothetical protein
MLFNGCQLGPLFSEHNLFSALCSALTCFTLFHLLYAILNRIDRNKSQYSIYCSLITTLLYSVTAIVWSQSIITEVYTLFSLLLVLTIYYLIVALESPSKGFTPLLLIFGLSIVHHRLSYIIIAYSGMFLCIRYAIVSNRTVWSTLEINELKPNTKQFALGFFASILPLLLLLYFPIRAWQEPAINWYNPQTYIRWSQLISGELYAHIIPEFIRNMMYSYQNNGFLPIVRNYTYYQFLPILFYSLFFIPILIGWITLFRKIPWLAIYTILLYGTYQTFVFMYRVGDWYVFLLPAILLSTIPLASGLYAILRFVESNGNSKRSVQIIQTVMFIGLLCPATIRNDGMTGIIEKPLNISNYMLNGETLQSRFHPLIDNSALDYSMKVWHLIPDGAPILTQFSEIGSADNEFYPIQYQQIVERRGENNPLIGTGFLYLDWSREAIAKSLNIPLEKRHDQKHQSRQDWLNDLWGSLVDPLLQQGPVYTLSHPIPAEWTNKLVKKPHWINYERRYVPYIYQPYLPMGYVYELHLAIED